MGAIMAQALEDFKQTAALALATVATAAAITFPSTAQAFDGCLPMAQAEATLKADKQYRVMDMDLVSGNAQTVTFLYTPARLYSSANFKNGSIFAEKDGVAGKELCNVASVGGAGDGQMVILDPQRREISPRTLHASASADVKGGINYSVRGHGEIGEYVAFQAVSVLGDGQGYLMTLFSNANNPSDPTSILYTGVDGQNIVTKNYMVRNIQLTNNGHKFAKAFANPQAVALNQ